VQKRLLRSLLLAAAAALGLAGPAGAAKYVVLYNQEAVPSTARTTIEKAEGTVIASYGEIGVVIASSDSPAFADKVLKDTRVAGAVSTAGFGLKVTPAFGDSQDVEASELPNSPAGQDPLFPLQWDMRQIHTPEAHAITGGSHEVVTGIIDTGMDKDHPDLIPNIDFSKSVSCESGAPVSDPVAWDDHNGHGTHTSGTVAAAFNGIGITGVAPNTRLAAIKSSIDEGFFFPEMVVCSFMWAGRQHLDVTNNSYFADPWYFNCMNDHEQHAIWKAEQRAIRFAMSQGVTVVAASGNFADDLAHPTRDIISPDFPPGSEQERRIRNNCKVIPVEVPGVIGTNATGSRELKASYSNYGVGVSDVSAPGGDRILQPLPGLGGGRVLSTFPAEQPCTRRVVDPAVSSAVYCYLQGTSMASPHAAGVAALIVSRFGDANGAKGHMSPGKVAALLQQTSDSINCPDDATLALYAPFPSTSNGAPQECQGGAGNNSWYGHGEINAFRAVTHATGR
jgi:lantibiotic leader peptide-processing serine protease